MIQIENLFNEVRGNLDRFQDDITATKDNLRKYREVLDKAVLQLNRVRMGRTPAYSDQAQKCSVCNKSYVFIKWCRSCDREQFRKQFSNWETGHPEFDKIIRDSQLSIKYPNGYVQWIPYEKFANIEFVGKGGFARVYKADWVEGLGVWDYALGERVHYPNTPVALKELINSVHVSKDFLEEVVAYTKSSSSTVLRCYGITRNPESKEYVMVFPYAHGGNLRNYVTKSLNWVNRLDVLRHILYGLADIHVRGLVHRDLHPGNILHYRRTMSVSDLGLCRPSGDVNESEEIFGVLPFIAPEVLNGEPYTLASDVYSIGMIMWFLTSGQYPFSDRDYNDYSFVGSICKESHALRPEVLKGTPPDYEKLMRECWDADPNKRPTTKELYQKVLFWLKEFDKAPLPDTIQQFITSDLEEPGEQYALRGDQLTSKSIKVKAVKEYRIKNKKTIDPNSDDGDDDDDDDDEADEWNTVHVNDYQNWLYGIDLMADRSGEKIATIVNSELRDTLKMIRVAKEKKKLKIDKVTKQTNNPNNPSIQVSDALEEFTR